MSDLLKCPVRFDLALSSQRYVVLELFIDLRIEAQHQLVELIIADYIPQRDQLNNFKQIFELGTSFSRNNKRSKKNSKILT